MFVNYKDDNTEERSPKQTNYFVTAEIFEKKIIDDNIKIVLENNIEVSFPNLCMTLKRAMEDKNVPEICSTISMIFKFVSTVVIHDIQDLQFFGLILNLLFIIENNVDLFDMDTRICSINIISSLIHKSTTICDFITSFNIVSFFVEGILFNNDLFPLHFHVIKCLQKIANHCSDCQNNICEKLPCEYIYNVFGIPIYDEDTDYEIVINDEIEKNYENENKEMKKEILLLLKNISKWALHPDLIEYCFNMFLLWISSSSTEKDIGLLGICYLTKQPRECWYKLFEQSFLYAEITVYLKGDPKTIESTLFLLSSIYAENQFVKGLQYSNIIDLLHYDDNPTHTSIRHLAAKTLNKIMKQDPNFIKLLIKGGLLDAFHDVFDESSFDVKAKLVSCLETIALFGESSDKVDLINNNGIMYLMNIIQYGNEQQICNAIRALENLFKENIKKICYESFWNTPGHEIIFEMSKNINKEVASLASQFLNCYFPLVNGKIMMLE
ncbi:hypothetical protein TRFO_29939 [Tritrichomonas foetus]|uniref:Uncharacterized protein n=1 Tax=Tritrichomonas foetus TaxID=1144522 RepID=A0A1J4JUI8_9EUKA|nr:hypothetical protein TRFO_29939 [Tritrichomonas foetus]|eukprot:OHT02809.1 hypothetical protein TRFO_29939 [Tritrichomonas foetus]